MFNLNDKALPYPRNGILRVESLTDQAYDYLKEDILTGKLKWGERLNIYELTDRFGVSRSPIIKAIDKLAHENLVEIIPNRGSFIVLPTEKDIRSITELRIMMENTGCKLATEKNYDRLVETLEENEKSYQVKNNKHDFDKFLIYDRNFHFIIIKLADNPKLLEMYSIVRSQSELFRTNTFKDENVSKAIASHQSIIEKLKTGNVDAMMLQMEKHIIDIYKDSMESLNNFSENE